MGSRSISPPPETPAEQIEESQMPVGMYTLVNPGGPTCGLANPEGFIGLADDPQTFLVPERFRAGMLWMSHGFVEDVFPNRVPTSVEICSKCPDFDNDYPSDVTVWINEVEIGTWTSPALLYAPKDARFHAFCPSLVQRRDRLVCRFGTNEDHADSSSSGTPANRMGLDIKTVESRDGGKTWNAPTLVYGGTHRNYLPSAVALPSGGMFVSLLDFDAGAKCVTGKV